MMYKFEVNENEAQLLLNGLAELPAKVSMALIQKLQTQGAAQNKPVEKSVEKPVEKLTVVKPGKARKKK